MSTHPFLCVVSILRLSTKRLNLDPDLFFTKQNKINTFNNFKILHTSLLESNSKNFIYNPMSCSGIFFSWFVCSNLVSRDLL